MSPTRVLYVAGAGRSGSTILARVLGELPGFCTVGELYYLWQEGWTEDRRCGCGEPFSRCPFWAGVMSRSGLGEQPETLDRMVRLHRRIARTRHLPLLATATGRRRIRQRHGDYLEHLGRLYGGIAGASGAEVLLDASKSPSYAVVLRQLPEVELYTLHLVRDPRAVAHSWRRRRFNPGSGRLFRRMSSLRSSILWLIWNFATERLARRHDASRYLRLSYEEFTAAPAAALERVARLVGADPQRAAELLEGSRVEISRHHTVSGNPGRFVEGEVALREDREWVRALPRWRTVWVTLLCAPLLRRYGYPWRPRPRAREGA